MNINRHIDTTKPLDPIAYSYLRFSQIIQGRGDSRRRQTTGAEEWEEQTGIPIIESMNDLGLSAYSNAHVEKGELGVFLEMCRSPMMKAKTESRDVFLVVENLDRLSRRSIMEAVKQLSEIVDSGIKVVTLSDGQVHDQDSLNTLQGLIISIAVMSRAHEESKEKARRVRKGKCAKVDRIRDGEKALLTSRVPFCYKVLDDGVTLEVIPEAAAICRRIFQMVADGETYAGTSRTLNQEGVRTSGSFTTWAKAKSKTPAWNPQGILRLISSHWPVGTFVSRTNGATIENYFPQVVDQAVWAKARKVAGKRKAWGGGKGSSGGRRGYNIFTNLARDAETGEGMQARNWGRKKQLLPASVRFGKRKGAYWDLIHFEKLFFTTIRLALDVDKSMDQEDLELTKTQTRLKKVEASLRRVAKIIIDDPDFDVVEIKAQMMALREEKNSLQDKEQTIREQIMAGSSLTLDPDETDREALRRAVKSNVKQILMNNDHRWFQVELQNGISYKVTCHQDGVVEVITDDFQVSDKIVLHPFPEVRADKWKPKSRG
jgi:DNA invertase Pin-like site-specific DNA recombinase